MTTLHGIKNCDTVKKARKWLDTHQVNYRFHDFRQDGLDPGQLAAWVDALGWEQLVNRRSTTWRNLAEDKKTDLNASKAIKLMLAEPTLIKRPVLEKANAYYVGFSASDYNNIF